MGGKNAMVMLDDADIDLAVTTIINAAFFSTGQKCTAASRIIVTEGIYCILERFLQRSRRP